MNCTEEMTVKLTDGERKAWHGAIWQIDTSDLNRETIRTIREVLLQVGERHEHEYMQDVTLSPEAQRALTLFAGPWQKQLSAGRSEEGTRAERALRLLVQAEGEAEVVAALGQVLSKRVEVTPLHETEFDRLVRLLTESLRPYHQQVSEGDVWNKLDLLDYDVITEFVGGDDNVAHDPDYRSERLEQELPRLTAAVNALLAV